VGDLLTGGPEPARHCERVRVVRLVRLRFQQIGQGPTPRNLCPRLQVFQPPAFASAMASSDGSIMRGPTGEINPARHPGEGEREFEGIRSVQPVSEAYRVT
jgi:hypothetical protein